MKIHAMRCNGIDSVLRSLLLCLIVASAALATEPPTEVLTAESQRIAVMAKASSSVLAIFDPAGQGGGSGVVITADGYALSNFHVTHPCGNAMKCGMSDGRFYDAVIVGLDPTGDVALIKLLGRDDFPHAELGDSDRLHVGDWVFAMGNPFLLATDFQPTVTSGIISGVHRYQFPDGTLLEYADCLQTDASINPGNSGGPLVDMNGDLIGVNTAIVSSSGASAGVGFAIPAVMAKQVVDAALSGGHVVARPWLGAKSQALTDEMAKSFGLEAPQGVVITDVWPGGSAFRAGIARGDVILSVGGEPINDDAALTYRIATRHPGDILNLQVRRAGQMRSVRLTVDSPPSTPAPDLRTIAGRNPLTGATVVNVSPASAQQYGVDPFAARGVLVTEIQGGFAQTIGVQPGDFIREINGQKVASTAELAAAVLAPANGWMIVIERNGQTITARFSG